MAKLTKAQKLALQVLADRPATITTWGGKPMGGMPEGIRSRSTIDALYQQGFVSIKYDGLKVTWSITLPGRAALSKDTPDV